jgi:hypothetical protein
MRKQVLEFWLDALLLPTFLLLLSPRMTGLALHEWIGVVFGIPVLVHLLFSWSWISTATRRVLASADRRARVNYVLNTTLFVLTTVEIVSGLVISQVALPVLGIATVDDRSWRALHNLTLNWTLLAAGLHVAINWSWIVAAVRRREWTGGIEIRLAPSFGRGLARGAVLLLGAGVVTLGAFALLGPPSEARLHGQNEIARFVPTLGHGLGQFIGESTLLAVVAYVGRRWLRVRLSD